MPEEADWLDVETVENDGSGHDFAARGSLNVFFVQDFCSLTAGEGVAKVYYSEAF